MNIVLFIRFLRISEFLERDLTIKINAKSDRRFDRSTVRTKFGVEDNLELTMHIYAIVMSFSNMRVLKYLHRKIKK